MNRRNLLKSIGTGVGTSATASTAIGDEGSVLNARDTEPDTEDVEEWLESEPVIELFDEMGLGNPKRRDISSYQRIGLDPDAAEATELTVSDQGDITGVRMSTHLGRLALTISSNTVVQAYYALDDERVRNWYLEWVSSPIGYEESQPVLLKANSEEVRKIRGATSSELSRLGDIIGESIERGVIYEDNENVYAKIHLDGEEIHVDINSGEIVKEKSFENKSDASIMGGCSAGAVGNCGMDLMTVGIHCQLSYVACGACALATVAGIVGCAAAIASLCGASVYVAHISGSCYDAASCIEEFCDNNGGCDDFNIW